MIVAVRTFLTGIAGKFKTIRAINENARADKPRGRNLDKRFIGRYWIDSRAASSTGIML